MILLEDVGAGDVGGHQVGGELDAVELEVEHLGQRRDQRGLRQPGHAHQQAVAAREEGDEQVVDELLLAVDPLSDLRHDGLAGLGDLLHAAEVVGEHVVDFGYVGSHRSPFTKEGNKKRTKRGARPAWCRQGSQY